MTGLDAQAAIRSLSLTRHPEGGWYRETFRDGLRVMLADGTVRSASTCILYLLEGGSCSAFHRVRWAEGWHWHRGGALQLHVLGEGTIRLDEEHPQCVVPAGSWQAAEAEEAVLCGCTVAPGFEFQDFELARRDPLGELHPEQAELIRRLCRR